MSSKQKTSATLTADPPVQTAQASAKAVARSAGVSLMTVSRVFSGGNKVAPETHRRVMEAAERLGYQPNPAARALRRGMSTTIGFMLASPFDLAGPYNSATLAALDTVLGPKGYVLSILTPTANENLAELLNRTLASRACAALVVRLNMFPEADLQPLHGSRTPVVFASNVPENLLSEGNLGAVRFNNRQGISLAVRHLASLGHRDIAFLGGTPQWFDSVRREQGFRETMKQLGLPVREEWIKACRFDRGHVTGFEAVTAIMGASDQSPTGFICASDEIAAGVYRAAPRWGKRIPDDWSVIGFDNDEWGEFVTPGLTTIEHSGWDLGLKTGTHVLRLLEDSEAEPEHIVMNTSLVLRGSTAPQKKSP